METAIKDELEDIGLAKAIDDGKTGEYVDIEEFLNSLNEQRV